MTKVYIFKKNDLICGFQVKGHSGYAENGHDIVCASISTAAQMAVVGVKEVQKLNAEVEIREGFLSLHLVESDAMKAQTILQTFENTVKEIAKQHDKFVKMEVKENVF